MCNAIGFLSAIGSPAAQRFRYRRCDPNWGIV